MPRKSKKQEKEEDLDVEKIKEELRDDMESSESEPEDEYGELLTEDVEDGLNKVLSAIKSGDKALFDPNVRFFKEEDKEAATEKKENSKPIYLKEYHRMNLLDANKEEEDGEVKPYGQQVEEEKQKLISEINDAIDDSDGDSDSDDDFLKKKEKPTRSAEDAEDEDFKVDIVMPDPEKEGGEKFLEAFMEKHAWVPSRGSKDVTSGMQEDDAEFDDAAERFENAYNFRYEDPNASEIISYARSQATMRREKANSRKKERKRQQDEKRQEKEEVQTALKKKKQKKMNLVMDRMKEVKEAVGEEIPEDVIASVFGGKLLEDDFDDEEWDKKMQEVFDKYYGAEEHAGEEGEEVEENEEVEDEEKEPEKDEIKQEESKEEGEKSASNRSAKRILKHERKEAKKQAKQVAEEIVEKKAADLLEEVEQERGRGKTKEEFKFKYREVSPESFGLTTRDILFADDSQLNDFVGLKKFAPYRSSQDRARDKKKYAKKRRLKEWRKDVFNDPEGPNMDVKIPSIVKGNDKKRRRRH